MKNTISNQNKAVKSETSRSFMLCREKAEAMAMLNDNDEFCIVRDQKGQLYIRIQCFDIRKNGTWKRLPFSVWGNSKELDKLGWSDLPKSQKRIWYEMTPATREQAVKWYVETYVDEEFRPDILAAINADGRKRIVIPLTDEESVLVKKHCNPPETTSRSNARGDLLRMLMSYAIKIWGMALDDAHLQKAMFDCILHK